MNVVSAVRRITVREYVPSSVPADGSSRSLFERLWKERGHQVDVEFPSPATGGVWRVTSRGWVGYVPLDDTHVLEILPRVAVDSLFGMLEYTYGLRSFSFLDGRVTIDSLAEFHDRLAMELARRVIDRSRRGLHRAYVGAEEELAVVRGRVDMSRRTRSPWRVDLPCSFEEHTADIDDNALLTWTLDRILRTGLCSERSLPILRSAHRRVASATGLRPFRGTDCVERPTTRLNADYEPMHALCRFFLDHLGPVHREGDREMLPFLVNMPRLFEGFVAAWLRRHAPRHWTVAAQRGLTYRGPETLSMAIDVVLVDRGSGRTLAVLDTKYKPGAGPTPADVQQVVTYAVATGCGRAVLVYPEARSSFRIQVGPVAVTALGFAVGGDMERAGQAFVDQLAAFVAQS